MTSFQRAVTVLALLCTTALSQETKATEEDEKSPILLRVICKQPVAGATDLKVVQEETIKFDLQITDSLMTEPFAIGRGDLLLARLSGGTDKPAFSPVLKVNIPKVGKRFVLALFSPPNPTPDKPYAFRLVRTDGLNFGSSDLYLFNLTTLPIGGFLGPEKFALQPDASRVVTPKPDTAGGRMYKSRFYCQVGDQTRIFNDTRWPLSKSARIYLFFIPDADRQSMGYLSFREYAPFP